MKGVAIKLVSWYSWRPDDWTKQICNLLLSITRAQGRPLPVAILVGSGRTIDKSSSRNIRKIRYIHSDLSTCSILKNSIPVILQRLDSLMCSKYEYPGQNLFYMNNSVQVKEGLPCMLGVKYRPDLIAVLVSNYSKTGK